MKRFLGVIAKFGSVAVLLVGCSSTPCKIEERKEGATNVSAEEKSTSSGKDLTSRTFVFKPDGSLQCGMGKKIDPNEMKKELGSMQVFSAVSKSDGLMRIQLCGHPTGQNNVFEISEKDLDQALKLGFKKWLRD